MVDMPCISVRELKKDYIVNRKSPGLASAVKNLFSRNNETITAVGGISFEVEEGEFVGFIGPNGAGKTTTIKMLSGVLYPTSGCTEVLGFTPSNRKREFLRQIAFVMGNKTQLWWDLPTLDGIALLRDIYEIPEDQCRASVDLLSDLLGLKKLLNVQVRKLSLGERMKCELMASLIHMPRVLFLDEPTIGLDLVSRKAIREFLKQYNKETGATVILTSHYLEDIKALCERIVFINAGRIVYDGRISDLMSEFAPEVIIKCVFAKPVGEEDLAGLGQLGVIVENSNNVEIGLRVPRSQGPKVASSITSDYDVEDLLIEEMPLDGILERMYVNEPVG